MSAFPKFDVDAEIQKLGCGVATPATPATQPSKSSGISKISNGTPADWNNHWDSPPDDLTEVTREHGLTLAELEEAAGPDWPEVEANIELADTLADAVKTRRMRERGQVPPNYTSVTVCAGCGLVPVWPDCPEHVLACPWCFNRAAGKPIPTPRGRSEQNEVVHD